MTARDGYAAALVATVEAIVFDFDGTLVDSDDALVDAFVHLGVPVGEISFGHAVAEECDRLGMSDAQRLAARRALDGLGVEPDRVLVDGRWDFIGGGRTRMLVKGDATCLSIAAASILAKVTRDRIMRAGADNYPGFDFDRNKGYPCPRHKLALKGYGPTAIHRRTWAFMDGTPWGTRRPGPDDAPTLF